MSKMNNWLVLVWPSVDSAIPTIDNLVMAKLIELPYIDTITNDMSEDAANGIVEQFKIATCDTRIELLLAVSKQTGFTESEIFDLSLDRKPDEYSPAHIARHTLMELRIAPVLISRREYNTLRKYKMNARRSIDVWMNHAIVMRNVCYITSPSVEYTNREDRSIDNIIRHPSTKSYYANIVTILPITKKTVKKTDPSELNYMLSYMRKCMLVTSNHITTRDIDKIIEGELIVTNSSYFISKNTEHLTAKLQSVIIDTRDCNILDRDYLKDLFQSIKSENDKKLNPIISGVDSHVFLGFAGDTSFQFNPFGWALFMKERLKKCNDENTNYEYTEGYEDEDYEDEI